jgi:hypothetical protein
MFKRLLPLIAVILVMTTELNAQCFASCNITSAAQPSDHACCPHHKAVHNNSPQTPALPVALAFAITPQLAPAPVSTLMELPLSAILPPPSRPSQTAALRI